MKKKVIIILFSCIIGAVVLLVYLGQWQKGRSALYYSGAFEATQAGLSFQTAGKAARILVREGEAVAKDQLLAELDRRELESRYNQAKAALEQAQHMAEQKATLLELYERTLPAEVERAESAVKSVAFNLAELEAGTRAQEIERAQQAMLAARAVMVDAEKNKGKYDSLFQKAIVSEKEWDAVRLRYETALREYERSREAYGLAREGVRRETIEAARARLGEAEAAAKQSRSNLKRIDAAQRDVEAARAQVRLAEAALEGARINLDYTELKAPFEGIIASRSIEPGEVVTPGQEVLTLADLSSMDLKIFVEETRIGSVIPGQKAEIRIDSLPDRVFNGIVSFISPEAEFTPKFIQTHKERVKLVYLVEISVPNPDLVLKPGMPADAWLK